MRLRRPSPGMHCEVRLDRCAKEDVSAASDGRDAFGEGERLPRLETRRQAIK